MLDWFFQLLIYLEWMLLLLLQWSSIRSTTTPQMEKTTDICDAAPTINLITFSSFSLQMSELVGAAVQYSAVQDN